jgi:hypothetical protein
MLFAFIGPCRGQLGAILVLSLGGLLVSQFPAFAGTTNMNVIAHASSGPLSCEIRRAGAGESVQLSGVVSGTAAVAGNFRFLLKKNGPSGTSNINQGNSFNLTAGAEAHVGSMTVNLRPDDQAVVELRVTSNDGTVCHATASLAIEL